MSPKSLPSTRRQFVLQAAAAAAALAAADTPTTPEFSCTNSRLLQAYNAAVAGLKGNVQDVFRFPRPVLLEGATYAGVWLECAPLEGLVYAPLSPETAIANHEVFFDSQREDGYLPCNVKKTSLGTGQIQMVVPIAATAWDLYRQNRSSSFLDKTYRACSRWDEWLTRYRNTRGSGLCEAFCTYDTGHDNSPRFLGKSRQCPNADARVCPPDDGLPYLAPDLSSTVYGGRIALAAIAHEMGRPAEESRWLEAAASIRKLILDRLYDARDAAFYDLDSHGRFVRIRGDVITRVMGEHVADAKLFEQVYRRQLHNPSAFWTPYPFPSIAADDPAFVRPIPRNSWGGASQALTALRTPRWMEHYGKYADFTHLMTQWVGALVRSGQFLQQMDPQSGQFSPDRGSYSPAMLTLFDFVWRLYGVRPSADTLEWNCRLPAETASTTFRWGNAELQCDDAGASLTLAGKRLAKIRGAARLVTTNAGKPLRLVGTETRAVTVLVQIGSLTTTHNLNPDSVIAL